MCIRDSVWAMVFTALLTAALTHCVVFTSALNTQFLNMLYLTFLMKNPLLDRIKKEAYQGCCHYANQSVYASRLLLQFVT